MATMAIEARNPCAVNGRDKAWFARLMKRIWTTSACEQGSGPHYFEKGELTETEWKRIKGLIEANELPCELRSGAYGNLQITVFDHNEVPGLERPEMILLVGTGNLPGASKKCGYDETFPWAWRIFFPITHSRRNQELLSVYGLEESKSQSHYEY